MTPARLLTVAPLLALLACAHSRRDENPAATASSATAHVADTASLDAPVVPIRGAQLVTADPARSTVQAVGAKVTHTHAIVFESWTGAMQVKKGVLVGVDVTVQVASLSTEFARLTAHLLTEDFLFTDVFPRARFSSTSVEPSPGPSGATHIVTGALTLHGHTETVSFPATVTSSGGELRADAELVIDRNDFGIVYPGRADDRILDDVQLSIQLVGDVG